jgi:hypothetical protein
MDISRELERVDRNIEIISNQLKIMKDEIEQELGYKIPEKLYDLFMGISIKSNDLKNLKVQKLSMNETKDIFIEIVKKYNLDMNLDEEELKNKKGWSSK